MTADVGHIRHTLLLHASKCGDRSVCWEGSCSCGAWTKGPHFMRETVQAYWQDHLYLEDPAAYNDLHPEVTQ